MFKLAVTGCGGAVPLMCRWKGSADEWMDECLDNGKAFIVPKYPAVTCAGIVKSIISKHGSDLHFLTDTKKYVERFYQLPLTSCQ